MVTGLNSPWLRGADLCASWWTRFVAFLGMLAGTVLGLSGYFASIFLPHLYSASLLIPRDGFLSLLMHRVVVFWQANIRYTPLLFLR